MGAYEFSRQISLVTSSGHDTMMDPVSMAMTAGLCAKLRDMAPDVNTEEDALALPSILPSGRIAECIAALMAKQQESGIWMKYFPMFQYFKSGAGGNYCFSFEMLEAILSEFCKRDGRRYLLGWRDLWRASGARRGLD